MFHKGSFQEMDFGNPYFIVETNLIKILLSNFEGLFQHFPYSKGEKNESSL